MIHSLLDKKQYTTYVPLVMKHLPTELKCSIFWYIDRTVLPKTRCVCKEWLSIIGTRYFTDVWNKIHPSNIYYEGYNRCTHINSPENRNWSYYYDTISAYDIPTDIPTDISLLKKQQCDVGKISLNPRESLILSLNVREGYEDVIPTLLQHGCFLLRYYHCKEAIVYSPSYKFRKYIKDNGFYQTWIDWIRGYYRKQIYSYTVPTYMSHDLIIFNT